MSRLKVAVAGAGYFARFHHDAWLRMEDADLSAVCDLDQAALAAIAGEHNLPVFISAAQMLDEVKPDLLDIATPPASHLPLIRLAMELGSREISIADLLQLKQGSVVELDQIVGKPLDVMVNGTLIAKGEVVQVNDRYGIRMLDIVSQAERIKQLK